MHPSTVKGRVVTACTRGGVVAVFALAIGVAAVPVELYLARATRRGHAEIL